MNVRVTSAITLASLLLAGQASAQNASWKVPRFWAGKQGPYILRPTQENDGSRGKVHKIRLINFEYVGPANPQSWKKAFWEVARHYIREDISYTKGADGVFVNVRNLSQSTKRIVGYVDETTGVGGYVVLQEIHPNKVRYSVNSGKTLAQGTSPNNYHCWRIGWYIGPTGIGVPNADKASPVRVRVQVWKHGHNNFDGCFAIWVR